MLCWSIRAFISIPVRDQNMPKIETHTRIEKDSLGEIPVAADAYYGAQTARAVANYPISGLRSHPALIRAYGLLK